MIKSDVLHTYVGTKEAVLKFQQNFEKQQHESESNIDTQEDGKQKALKKRKLISSEVYSLYYFISTLYIVM